MYVKNGWTALVWTSHNGHLEVTKLLIDAGADVHAQCEVIE
jgi:ankyrin repeat protein